MISFFLDASPCKRVGGGGGVEIHPIDLSLAEIDPFQK